jgi:hypothetical protein
LGEKEVMIAAISVGSPCFIIMVALLRGWWVKGRELKVQEKRIQMEERLRSEELNARILRSEEPGISASDLCGLTDELRQLRQEVAQLRQEVSTRTVG